MRLLTALRGCRARGTGVKTVCARRDIRVRRICRVALRCTTYASAEPGGELVGDVEEVGDGAEVGDVEDRRSGVGVHGDDQFGALHALDVLGGAGDAEPEV